MTTYYTSAEGVRVTWTRALAELAKHGLDDAESIRDFKEECWSQHAEGDLVGAADVLDWLGY